MADADLATKAPESDAAAPSSDATEPVIPGDTPAQTGPAMGEHCVSDRPTRSFPQPAHHYHHPLCFVS